MLLNIVEFSQCLQSFCVESTLGRDSSHGEEHMSQVRDNALVIWLSFLSGKEDIVFSGLHDDTYDIDKIERYIIAVSQLHDVGKYEK